MVHVAPSGEAESGGRAQPIKLPKALVIEKARAAYLEGRLSAQGPWPRCAYRDRAGRPCVIGAALTDAEAYYLDTVATKQSIGALVRMGYVKSPAPAFLQKLQLAHDDWAMGLSDDKPLRKLLGIRDGDTAAQ